MRFLVDAQLPPALARMISAAGHLAEHVVDIGPADATDGELWRYALEHGAVIVTKDEDFADRAAVTAPAPVIVWLRQGNTTRRVLLDWFMPHLEDLVRLVESGATVVELR